VRKLIETTVDPDLEDDEDLTSRTDARTERRRSEAAWAEFAKTLVTISERHLLRMQLGEELLRTVQETRRITSPGARNRALRLVRQELRGLDLQQLRERLEDLSHPSTRRAAAAPSPADDWRERLLRGGEAELALFIDQHPNVDRQRFRSLLRNARKANSDALKLASAEAEGAAPSKASVDAQKKALAALSQALRDALSASGA
jgi:ribosome-associated protein